MPISTRVYNDIAMSTLNRITGDIQGIQQRIATGRNIIKTSDNPAVGAKISFTKDRKFFWIASTPISIVHNLDCHRQKALSKLASIYSSECMNWVSRHGTTPTMLVIGRSLPWRFAI